MIPSYEGARRSAVTGVTLWITRARRTPHLEHSWSVAAVTYLHNDAERAQAKVRTLQRLGNHFKIKDARTELELRPTDLEQATQPR